MLQANKSKVLTEFHQTALEVRQQEIDYFLSVFENLAAVAGLFGGFAAGGLLLEAPEEDWDIVVLLYLIVTALALGANLIVIFIATLCTVLAPGKALRGNDAAEVHQTVALLEAWQKRAMQFFMAGAACYFVSAALVVWLVVDFVAALVSTAMLVVFLLSTAKQTITIRRALIAEAPYTVGQIHFNPIDTYRFHT